MKLFKSLNCIIRLHIVVSGMVRMQIRNQSTGHEAQKPIGFPRNILTSAMGCLMPLNLRRHHV